MCRCCYHWGRKVTLTMYKCCTTTQGKTNSKDELPLFCLRLAVRQAHKLASMHIAQELTNGLTCALTHAVVPGELYLRARRGTVGQNNQKYSSGLLAHLFACTVHSFACSALLASLTRSAALTCSLARSLRPLPRLWDSEWLDGYFICVSFLILDHSAGKGSTTCAPLRDMEWKRAEPGVVIVHPLSSCVSHVMEKKGPSKNNHEPRFAEAGLVMIIFLRFGLGLFLSI